MCLTRSLPAYLWALLVPTVDSGVHAWPKKKLLVLGTTTSALGLACWGRGLRGSVWSNSVY